LWKLLASKEFVDREAEQCLNMMPCNGFSSQERWDMAVAVGMMSPCEILLTWQEEWFMF
jgi:hypothetical protein